MATDNTKAEKRGRSTKAKSLLVDEQQERLVMDRRSDDTVNYTKEIQKIQLSDLNDKYQMAYNKAVQVAGGSSSITSSVPGGIYSPFIQNQRLKKIYTLPKEYDKVDIVDALKSPGDYENLLRGVSWSLSSSQYIYYKILREAADVPCYKHYIVPENLDSVEDYKSESFKKEQLLLNNWVDKFDIVNSLKKISLEVKREGKSVYILRNSFGSDVKGNKTVNYAQLQKLPTDYVKITGLGSLGYTASLNMMLFMMPGFDASQYGDYIQKAWESMNEAGMFKENKQVSVSLADKLNISYKGKPMKSTIERTSNVFYYWLELPQELAYVFCSDTSNPWMVPDTAGLTLNLQNLNAFTEVSGLLATVPLVGVLTGEIEFSDGAQVGRTQTKIDPSLIGSLENEFNELGNDSIRPFFAPLKNLKLQNMPNSANSSDILTSATQNFLAVSGEAATIPNTDKPSIYALKVAVKLLSSQYQFVTQQFERVLNFIINNLLGMEFKWKIKLFGDIFSIDDEKSFLKEMVAGGAMFFLPKLMACEDLTVDNSDAITKYLTSTGLYEKLVSLTMLSQSKLGKTTSTNSSTIQDDVDAVTPNKGGRPANNDPDSDATAAAQERGDNVSEVKNEHFDENSTECLICHKHLDYQGQKICEECQEKFGIQVAED